MRTPHLILTRREFCPPGFFLLISGEGESFHESHHQRLAECRKWQRGSWTLWRIGGSWETQIGCYKLKDLSIKPFVSWTEKGAKQNSGTNPGPFFFIT